MALLKWIGLGVCVPAVAAVVLAAIGSKRWADRMAALTRGLEAGRKNEATLMPPHQNQTAHYDARELEGLPAPVQRYFRAVLHDGQPIVSAVTIDMAGSINMSATAQQWKPFT